MARVRLSLSDGGAAVLVEAGAFPASEIDAFRSAVEGATYDRERRARVATVDRLPAMLRRMREARIDVDVSAEVAEALARYEKSWWLDVRGAEDRIAAIDAQIRADSKGARSLRPDQREGSRWLLQRRGALLADQPRVGKSIQAIAALPPRAGVIIIAPAAVKANWVAEFKKWKPNSPPPRVLSGRGSFRWPKPGEVLITNYDILPDIHDRKKCDGKLPPETCGGCRDVLVRENGRLRRRHTGHTKACDRNGRILPRRECPGCHPLLDACPSEIVVIGDEMHRAKSKTSSRANKVRGLFARVRLRGGWTWGLTGTPMENDPLELWWVFVALGIAEEAFGSFEEFKRLFRGKRMDFGSYVWGVPDSGVAERIVRVALRRMRRDVFKDLPEKIYEEIEIDLDADKIAEADEALAALGGADRVVELLEEEKIEFKSMSRVLTALAAAKIPAAMDLVDEYEREGDPILVWSMHTLPLQIFAGRKGWDLIDGSVDLKERERRIAAFQAGKLRGLACAIKAVGEGVKLSRAGRAVFIDESWSPTQNEQAEDRPIDPENNRGYVVTILKGKHKLDRRITEVNLRKRRIIAASVDAASALVNDPSRLHGWEGELRIVRNAGDVVRTFDAELATRLHDARFDEDRARERVALELAEESTHVGLTADGWALALRVLEDPTQGEESDRQPAISDPGACSLKPVLPGACSRKPEALDSKGDSGAASEPGSNPVDEPGEESYQEEGPDDLLRDPYGDEHVRGCPAPASRYQEACSCGSVDEAVSRERREGVARADQVVQAFKSLSEDERSIVLEEIEDFCCLGCGHTYVDDDERLAHDMECSASDEVPSCPGFPDEDEDGDDGEPDDESEDEDDDDEP